MSLTKYESDVKLIYALQSAVYAKLSDLSHLSTMKSQLDNPLIDQNILEKAGKKVSAEQLQKIKQVIRNAEFTPDSAVINGTPLGSVTLRIVERTEPTCIKYALEGLPVEAYVWVQLLPHEQGTRMKCTLGAELNFFIKKMVDSKAKEGVQGLAQMLASLPY